MHKAAATAAAVTTTHANPQLHSRIATLATPLVRFNLFHVSCRPAADHLHERLEAAQELLLSRACTLWHSNNVVQVATYEGLAKRLQQQPETAEEMDELEKFVKAVEGRQPELE